MARPHPALLDIGAGRPVGVVADTDALVTSASEHGMSGLLWSRMRVGEVAVDGERALQLAAGDVARREHSEALASALERAVSLLRDRGIASAAFKGVCTERRSYVRPGERPSRDVDLLVAPGDVHRFGEAVDALDPDYALRAGVDRRIALGMQQAATLRFDGVSVDLHADVATLGVPSRANELVWERVTSLSFDGGREVPVLDAEGELYALATHLIKDRFARLINHVDVVRLAGRADLDWSAMRRMAAADGLDGLLPLAVEAVHTTLDVPLPQAFRRPRGRKPLGWSLLHRPGSVLAGTGPPPRRQLLVPLVIPGRRGEVLQWLLRRVLPPAEVSRDLYSGVSANPVARLWRARRPRP